MKTRRISCPIRCLKEEDVRRAREGLAGNAFSKVPYLCRLSGKREEVLLIAQQRIEELSVTFSPLGDPLSLKILYALISCELCECDIATLVEQDEEEVVNRLDNLHSLGLLQSRKIQDMNYYSVAIEDLRDFLVRSLHEAKKT